MRNRLSYANVAATLALVLAIGGGGSAIADPIADTAASTVAQVKKALKIGKQAKKSSKQALRTAKSAKATADRALTASADTYSKTMSDGRYMLKAGVPVRALAAADSDKLDGLDSAAFARAGKTTAVGGDQLGSGTYDCFDNGSPSVTVEVGSSGLVAVYAEAIMAAGSNAISPVLRAQLYEPTAIPGCETLLLRNETSGVPLQTTPGSSSGTTNRGGWLIIRVPEGERTFSLRYGHTGSGVGAPPLASQAFLHVVPL